MKPTKKKRIPRKKKTVTIHFFPGETQLEARNRLKRFINFPEPYHYKEE